MTTLAITLLLLAMLMLSGCVVTLPSDSGPVKICFPAKSMRCNINLDWWDA